VWETRDPEGRLVVLLGRTWRHIVDDHPDLRVTVCRLLAIVELPLIRIDGRIPGEVWNYGRGGPSRFVKVVVHYEHDLGRLVTAFARRRFP
jgi:hypothetical protein